LGLRPLAFDREDAIVPFLLLAVAIGAVHVLLGLVLGVVSARRHPRQAMGRGISALMIVLVILALLAAVGVLPRQFFSPAAIGLLVAFPVLIVLEGLVAPIELLATLGNILSYARIMALGVASVMLAVVANKMVGAIGSVAVGILFALLFHLVNFVIAVFSPTIHALRLHYVEFFGKFYSPGGVRYQPFGHWTRAPTPARAAPRTTRHAA
jgi:V/A-type H+-transporting ATPase subunit I